MLQENNFTLQISVSETFLFFIFVLFLTFGTYTEFEKNIYIWKFRLSAIKYLSNENVIEQFNKKENNDFSGVFDLHLDIFRLYGFIYKNTKDLILLILEMVILYKIVIVIIVDEMYLNLYFYLCLAWYPLFLSMINLSNLYIIDNYSWIFHHSFRNYYTITWYFDRAEFSLFIPDIFPLSDGHFWFPNVDLYILFRLVRNNSCKFPCDNNIILYTQWGTFKF